jgi:hypothetical protein
MAGESEESLDNDKKTKPYLFQKGNPGGPGRPPGSVSLLTILKDELAKGAVAQELVLDTIRQAKEGSPAALKLVWDRIEGPVRTELTGLDGEALFPAVDLTKLSAAELKAWYELASKAEHKLLEAD